MPVEDQVRAPQVGIAQDGVSAPCARPIAERLQDDDQVSQLRQPGSQEIAQGADGHRPGGRLSSAVIEPIDRPEQQPQKRHVALCPRNERPDLVGAPMIRGGDLGDGGVERVGPGDFGLQRPAVDVVEDDEVEAPELAYQAASAGRHRPGNGQPEIGEGEHQRQLGTAWARRTGIRWFQQLQEDPRAVALGCDVAERVEASRDELEPLDIEPVVAMEDIARANRSSSGSVRTYGSRRGDRPTVEP